MARVQLHRFIDCSSPRPRRVTPLDRGGFLAAAVGLAATTAMAPQAVRAQFRSRQRTDALSDPNIVVIDKRFKYRLGNTPIQRLNTGTL